jgi:hypothetical protein
MGLLDRFRKPQARHLALRITPSRLRAGETVAARVEVTDPDAVQGPVTVGLRCRRNQRRTGVSPSGSTISDPIFETYDRKEVYSDWRELEGSGPWDVSFTVPSGGPTSQDRARGRHAWRVEVRERRNGAKDPTIHSSLIVR